MSALRMVFGDQLSPSLASLKTLNEGDVIFMCEVAKEATQVKHHKKKIAFIFAAMRHFAKQCEAQGWTVDYVTLDDPQNTQTLEGEWQRALKRHALTHTVVTAPSEYRVWKMVQGWANCECLEDDRFLCSMDEFQAWAKGRKQLRMEYFYRDMRRRHQILMAGDQPIGGQWNFDADNRQAAPEDLEIPAPTWIKPDAIAEAVMRMVAQHFGDHYGDLEPFYFALTRQDALHILSRFIEERLPNFGTYQDAMLHEQPWMFHAHISFYLNLGLLTPKECIAQAQAAYHDQKAPLNAVEGFIRQVLGWREYVRGIYWLYMPQYSDLNFFKAKRPLPEFFWHGQSTLHCLDQSFKQTQRYAYAHHIQRLMVIGNFALLAGLDPNAVSAWYLIVYADAFEWVEHPNVYGMILFADGGLLASKPYAAGGHYIDKMSNYCQHCRFNVKKKSGEEACPFHYLYWDFMARNREALKNNQRIRMMLATYDRMSDAKRQSIREDAQRFLDTLT